MDKKILKDLNFKAKYGIYPDTIKLVIALIVVAILEFAIVAMAYWAI